MGKESWARPAPAVPDQGAKGAAVMAPPEETAAESHRQLVERGWCAWRCEGLGGDTIVVVIDDTIPLSRVSNGCPTAYPVYTLQELADILGLDDQLLQAAHRAKKELGAQISGAETNPAPGRGAP